MFELINVTKSYGNKKAVDDVSFLLSKGELCGFVGGNGAGKTTLIKIITGIISFDFGDVVLDGISIKDTPKEFKKNIAYVPDIPYIYDYMTPMAFWCFILDVYEVNPDYGVAMIEKYSKLFELNEHINQPISSFSKGMRQKVALIAAFIHPSKVYILDEPFSGLDPKSILALKKVLKNKIEDDCCILFSTHILDIAEKICNRIIAIKDGKVIIDEIYKDNQKSSYGLEAKLIGVMYDEQNTNLS